jgi:glutathione S-transferase
MILIGQYDSPFVRRVGIALTLYGRSFRHEPWSAFGDVGRLRTVNPLTRVPTLVLDDGEALFDSHMILDYLDGLMPPDRRLFPPAEPDRHRALRRAALATGIGDKAVALFYELRLHDKVSDTFVARCRRQIADGWALLEPLLPDGPPGHAEIAAACVWRFTTEAHPGMIEAEALPRLAELSGRLEATAAFRAIYQPFIAPA